MKTNQHQTTRPYRSLFVSRGYFFYAVACLGWRREDRILIVAGSSDRERMLDGFLAIHQPTSCSRGTDIVLRRARPAASTDPSPLP